MNKILKIISALLLLLTFSACNEDKGIESLFLITEL